MSDERRAEIEAVVKVLVESGCGSGWAYPRADRILSAIGRVRDARGTTETICGTCGSQCMAENCDRFAPVEVPVRDARGDDEPPVARVRDEERPPTVPPRALDSKADRLARLERDAARSPQGEGHEARLRAILAFTDDAVDRAVEIVASEDYGPSAALEVLRQAKAALARVPPVSPSPSRDGTVAVEDVVRWLQHIDRLDEIAGAKAGLPKYNPLWDAAEAITIVFGSPASTGDREAPNPGAGHGG